MGYALVTRTAVFLKSGSSEIGSVESITTAFVRTFSSKKASQVDPAGMMFRTCVSTTALHSP